jgi:hypothetical protein
VDELKVPQAPVDPQVTDQVTPAFAESLATVAVIGSVAFAVSEVTAPVSVTVIGATAAVIVIVADATFVVSFTEVAVTVTVFPVGTALGAL